MASSNAVSRHALHYAKRYISPSMFRLLFVTLACNDSRVCDGLLACDARSWAGSWRVPSASCRRRAFENLPYERDTTAAYHDSQEQGSHHSY
jgi:hypothetical protein